MRTKRQAPATFPNPKPLSSAMRARTVLECSAPLHLAQRMGGLVLQCPELPISPNVRNQFVWDLVLELKKQLAMKGSAGLTAGQEYLEHLLEAVVDGKVDRQAFNERMFIFARTRAGAEFSMWAKDSAPFVLECSSSELKLGFESLMMSESRRVRKAAAASRAPRTLVLGRSIVRGVLESSAGPKGSDNLSLLLERVTSVPPFAWGHLATSVGVTDAVSFLGELRETAPGDVSELATFLLGDSEAWRSVSAELRRRGAPVQGGSPLPRLTELRERPDGSEILKEQAVRLSRALSREPAGQTLVASTMRARQRLASELLAGLFDELVGAVGAKLAARLFLHINVDTLVASIAAPVDGTSVEIELTGRATIAKKVDRLRADFAGAALREACQAFRRELNRSAELGEVARVVRTWPKDLAATGVTIGEVLLRYSQTAADAGTPWGSRLLAAAAAIHRPGGIDAALLKMSNEVRQDPQGFIAELREHWQARYEMELAALHVLREERASAGGAEPKAVFLDEKTRRAIEQTMEAEYPTEGIGYLAVEGTQLWFAPVKNGLRGTSLGRTFGVDDETDRERVHWLFGKLGLRVFGKVHSHCNGNPAFSDEDLLGVRQVMALAPKYRMMIDGIDRLDTGKFTHQIASFVGGEDGQVRWEDTVAAA